MRKVIYRVFSLIFAFFIMIYPFSQMFAAPVKALETKNPLLTAPHTEEKTLTENIYQSEESPEPYEKLSAMARKTAAALNIPLAGYETDETAQTVYQPVKWKDTLLALIASPKNQKVNPNTKGRKSPLRNSPDEWTEEAWNNFVTIPLYDGTNPISNFDATYASDIRENDDTSYHITRTHDFGIKYTVTFTTGKSVDVGNAVIRIPSEIFRDRNNQPVSIRSQDGIALPLYTENPVKNTQTDDYAPLYSVAPDSIVKSNRTQFGYFIETDDDGKEYYVIVNYDPIRPGTNWFEIVYDEMKAFDIPDETTWTISPDIDVQYKYEMHRYVLGGFSANLDNENATLLPISFDWHEALPVGFSEPAAAYVGNDGTVYYFQSEPDGDNIAGYLYLKNPDGTSSKEYAVAVSPVGQIMKQNEQGEWTDIVPHNIAPVPAVYDACICERVYDHDTYYCIDSVDHDDSGREILVSTYYNSDGNPVYQERILNGISSYYKISDDGQRWEANPNIRQWLPEKKWETHSIKQNTPEPLTGIVDTTANLDSVVKKAGEVTSNITGDMRSESQILSFIPEEQRENANINLENNIYVLWEVDISGKDCTQPFELYIDEALSYYNRQGSALQYTYYDSVSGNMVENTTDGSTALNYDGRIIGVTGISEPEIPVLSETQPYQPIANSDGFWYIGSSDPLMNSDPQNEGLTNVRNKGTYEKKVYIIAEYPKGNFPANGVAQNQSDGVCIDTLEEVPDGKWVYIPHGATMQGHTIHYLDTLFKSRLGDAYDDTKGNLVERSVVKEILQTILDEELGTSSSAEVSPLLQDFIYELTFTLPQTDELEDILSGMTREQIKEYIIQAWRDPDGDHNQQQIQKACQTYLSNILDNELHKLKVHSADGTEIQLKSYDKKEIYREVKNDVNVVLKPLDDQDENAEKTAAASHTRVDRTPSVQNKIQLTKKAKGGKKGWIDMYDMSEDELFRSTFSFEVNSSCISFNETHPEDYAFFYDNHSFIHLVTADDIVTAEPMGTASDGGNLYGGSCILDERDYCYIYAKIIVNERIYDVVDDTSQYGATTLSDDALLNASAFDRNWYIYVSYGTDINGNTIWESTPYAIISIENYINENPNLYASETNGVNVLPLDFSQDTRQPFRIKVEHNTIDHTSSVKMLLTAAVKKDSPHLCKPDNEHIQSLRYDIYNDKDSTNTAFRGDDTCIDTFKLRLHNYSAFYAQKYILSEKNNTVSAQPDKILTETTPARYDLFNAAKVNENTNISPDDKLTDELYVSPEPMGLEANTFKRATDFVDLSRLEQSAYAEKNSEFSNDLTHGRAHLTYRIAGYEGYQLDSAYKDELDTLAQNYHYAIPGDDRRKIYIYDLLPPGVKFEGYSGTNAMPVAGFLKRSSHITEEENWITTDDNGEFLINVETDAVSEQSPEWDSWGGVQSGRYLIRFTLTLPENAEEYALAEGGHWFFGVGIRFNANVSWERYTIAKNTPNLAVYVTDSETIGKHISQTYRDDGTDVPYKNGDIYKPFRNSDNDENKTDFDCNPDTPTDIYNRMYASSMNLGDIARSSSTAIGKQVRADSDIFALYAEKAAVITGDGYSYAINVENQTDSAISGIILYDVLENADVNSLSWQGSFNGIDTSYLSLNGITPKVYYSDTLNYNIPKSDYAVSGSQPAIATDTEWTNNGWKLADNWGNRPLSEVKSVAIALYQSNGVTPYIANKRELFSYKVLMKAPTNINISEKRYAKNSSHYCYYKVNGDKVDEDDNKYYNEEGNKTVVTLGERRILKVAKHVEDRFTDIEAVHETEYIFRLTRYMGFYEDDIFEEADVPCANIRYRLYKCSFTEGNMIESVGQEIEPGIIHTTNENGEFILHDGECAVFRYIPSANPPSGHEDEYDFGNYKITEQSKPFWYDLKEIDNNRDMWFEDNSQGNPQEANPQPSGDSGTKIYYKNTDAVVTNTYRPVIYTSKTVGGVPADMPTNPMLPNKDGTMTRQEAFNTFDYLLELYEYPVNRLTGEYFGNDAGYDVEVDTDGDGILYLSDTETAEAAWVKFRKYYDNMQNLVLLAESRINSLHTAIDSTTDENALRVLYMELNSWENMRAAVIADEAVYEAHIDKAGGRDRFFKPPQLEDENYNWHGDNYLKWTISNRLILPISGFSDNPLDLTYKSFANKVSDNDDRKNGAYIYRYIVGSEADIYSTPEGWDFWETDTDEKRSEICSESNPIKVQVRAGEIAAFPLFIKGGMMYSDYGIDTDSENNITYTGNILYTPRYCYRFREDMDNKYWDDLEGEYKTVPQVNEHYDTEERSWYVNLPVNNKPFRNTLGVLDENIADYDNIYRFKDLYLKKSVEPSEHVPKNDDKNSVDKTAFIYRIRRTSPNEDTLAQAPPMELCREMTWELWTRDNTGKLLHKLMIAPVTDDGYIIAPIANYEGIPTMYTIKIRHAEVGHTYYIQEVLDKDEIFGDNPEQNFEQKFPYADYDTTTGTFSYRYDENASGYTHGNCEKVFFCTSEGKGKTYMIATNELYAVSASETSGTVHTSDYEFIREQSTKEDMFIDNVYKLRNLTVTKSIIAENIDNNMKFTVQIHKKDNTAFSPTAIRFYRMAGGQKEYLSQDDINQLQGVGSYAPNLTNITELQFYLRNGIYAEIVDIGNEFDIFRIREKDWDNSCSYIHLDPVGDTNGWSVWKDITLGDNTVSTVRNGDEGYMIISKDYISDSSGDYDDFARRYLENDGHKIYLSFGLRERGSGSDYIIPQNIPEGSVKVNGENITDLSRIPLNGGQSAVINLRGLCMALNFNYDNIEYKVNETIPEDVQSFADIEHDILYSTAQFTPNEELQGDKNKTSVEVQNKVTRYRYVIYKRIGGKQEVTKPSGNLVLQLRDGGGNNRQCDVKWIATGESFDRSIAQRGITEEDGKLAVTAFDGWYNADDGNLTYFAKIYFNRPVECNLRDFHDEHVLDITEDMEHSDSSWGHLIGYETYGEISSYVSPISLENSDQWRHGQNTIVNTTETLNDRRVEVLKAVKPSGNSLTDEDRETEFTFKVQEFINDVYEDAPGISYTIFDENGTEIRSGITDNLGSLILRHGQQAKLNLPLYSYWKIIESGKELYRLVTNDHGEIVYDRNHNHILDAEDGLAPNETAENDYHAQRTTSGFKFHTDLDIIAGVEEGDPVVLRRGLWDSYAQDYSFVIYQTAQDDISEDTYYSTTSERAMYYKSGNIYNNDSAKVNNGRVYGGIIYADMKRRQPIWYDSSNPNISDEIKQSVAEYWKNTVTIPEYIYYPEGYSRLHNMYKHKVIGIASSAFSNGSTKETTVTSVTVPKTVKKIGADAFYNCQNLHEIHFAESGVSELLSIGNSAFVGTPVTEFHIPEGVMQIGQHGLDVLKNTQTGIRYYLPSTLIYASKEILFGNEDNNSRSKGILVLKSGLDNPYVLESRKNENFIEYFSGGSPLRPGIIVMENIRTIPEHTFRDNSEKARHTRIFIFPKDDENGTVTIENAAFWHDGQNYSLTDFGRLNHLFVWRSSNIIDETSSYYSEGLVFQDSHHNDISCSLDTSKSAYNNNMLYMFTEISSTENEKVTQIKYRFAIDEMTLTNDTVNGHAVAYYLCQGRYSGHDFKVIFKDQMSDYTAEDIYEMSGFGASKGYIDGIFNSLADPEIRSYVSAILNESCTRSAPQNNAPMHTQAADNTFIPEALWLMRKHDDD